MNFLWSLLIGLLIGLLARVLVPGRDDLGIVFTILLGMVGAIVAELIGQGFGFYHSGEPAGFLSAVLGAMLVLFVARRIQRTA